MKKIILLSFLTLLFATCQEKNVLQNQETFNLIPFPNQMTLKKGKIRIDGAFNVKFKNISDSSKTQWTNYLKKTPLNLSDNANNSLIFIRKENESFSDEAYKLTIGQRNISISAPSDAGLFYGMQTLLQLIKQKKDATHLPCLEIDDAPRFRYRGLMLDVSRHFFSLNFLKKQIDVMAQFKLNRFHWHLTDGPGWRIEIKQYPALTDIAAWRTDSLWKDWWATNPRKYVSKETPGAYGGYYTQDEAHELIQYAAARHVEIIPEIEMPGHSEEVLAVYPQLSCTGKPYTSSEFCIGNEDTFTFLENVLSEIAALFPSPYIHIGGDEASRTHWKKCPKCQARMKTENLKNEDELQSYLIKRIETYLRSKGKQLLGWDEIMEGGLAPEATVMSWRGEEAGIKAAEAGHDVIMTPGKYCYLDQYQDNPDTQPEAIGGYLPIENVYSYNPIPDTLSEKAASHVVGVQANLWTEYIATENHAEYMIYPRLLALAEVAWMEPQQKSWNSFKKRINSIIPMLQSQRYNPFLLSEKVRFSETIDTTQKVVKVVLSSEKYPAKIRYTTNGSTPNLQSSVYNDTIFVMDSARVCAQIFQHDLPVGKPFCQSIGYHKAIGKKVIYHTPINNYYPAGGNGALTDGLKGGFSHGDKRWQGFMTDGMEITIDLEQEQQIHHVGARFMQSIGPWIWFPKTVIIATSHDNKDFREIARIENTVSEKASGTLFQKFKWHGKEQARYIRYQALSNGITGGWIFLDEVEVW